MDEGRRKGGRDGGERRYGRVSGCQKAKETMEMDQATTMTWTGTIQAT